MYGNSDESSAEDYRVFPYIMSRVCPFFSFKSSRYSSMHYGIRFGTQKSKASTARVAMWKDLAIPAVYTLEASFMGPDATLSHFTAEQLMGIGKSVCLALGVFVRMRSSPTLEKLQPLLCGSKGGKLAMAPARGKREDNELARKIMGEIRDHRELLMLRMFGPEMCVSIAKQSQKQQDSGSDSSPSEDNLDQTELAEISPECAGAQSANLERIEVHVETKKRKKPSLFSNQRLVIALSRSGESTPETKAGAKTPAARPQWFFARPVVLPMQNLRGKSSVAAQYPDVSPYGGYSLVEYNMEVTIGGWR